VSRQPALELRRLTVSYGARPVLWDVDAAFPDGALSAVVGPNGAGKSTLLQAALGLLPSDAGQALIEGRPARAALDRVAYVPQRDAVDWDFPITVREVAELGRLRHAGWIRRLRAEDKRAAAEALERVGMTAFADRQIGALSGGQRQRAFLARALAQQAPVLVMDEPFAGVDARTEAALLDLLGEVRDDPAHPTRSVVLVHHDLGTVRTRFDHVLVLNVRTIAEGPVRDVLVPEVLRRAYGAGAGDADAEDVTAWAR
jgi:manganese/zinc/iron transport system ATP- binding protein